MAIKGKFIVFEGIDGSGKTTQIRMLAKELQARGIPAVETHEPTDSAIGSLLRRCLKEKSTDEYTVAALFAADRLDHICNPQNGILRTLEQGITVLCDRFYLSSFAYNGGFVPLEWVISLNEQAMRMLTPDLTVFLDVDPQEGMTRVTRRSERERYETLERQRKIYQNYRALFEKFPNERIAVVGGDTEREETHARIVGLIDKLFSEENP